jgi:hypothetical protein
VRNKAAVWVLEAIDFASRQFPFPILGIDSDYADSRTMPTFARSPSSAVVTVVVLSA